MKRNLFAISLITLSCLYGLLAAVLILVFFILEWPITIGLGISIAFIIIQFMIAPAVNDFVFKHFYKVKWQAELPEYLENMFSISTRGKSAMSAIDEMLYSTSYCVESANINAIPVYSLQPNTRISISD